MTSPSDSEDSGFDNIAVEEPGLATPDRSDLDATEDENEDLDATSPPQPTKSGVGNKGKVIEVAKADRKSAEPPPRRDLPFERIGGKGKEKVAPSAVEEEEEEDGEGKVTRKIGRKVEEADAEMNDEDAETSDDEL